MEKIVLGTVQMGLNYGINNSSGKVSIKESHQILLKAFNSNIRTLDTAELYGNAHKIIGDFHKKNDTCKFEIITKFPHDIEINRIEDKVLDYLDVLDVKCIEVLMFHSFESFKNNLHAIDLLNQLKLKGYINHIGVSVYTNHHMEYLVNENSITVVQLPFNLLDNISVRGNLIQKLKDKGKIIHTRSAFLQGLFFKNTNDKNKTVKKLYSELEILKQVVSESQCSMEELALSYCIQQDNIDNVIIGVDSIDQLKSNIEASFYVVRDDVIQIINKIKVKDLNLLNPSLWQS